MILICVKLHNSFTRHGFGGLVKQRETAFQPLSLKCSASLLPSERKT